MLVLSANYRAYDPLEPNGLEGVVLYTETTRENIHLSGRYLGKAPKCAPQLLGHADADILWIDGSMRWTGLDLTSLFDLVPLGGVGCFPHRFRNCIYAEKLASESPRYQGEPLEQQAALYRKLDHPEHGGLWETGIVVWRGAQARIGEAWLAEQLTWTSQDQISLPFVLRRKGVEMTNLCPGTAVENPWFVSVPHVVPPEAEIVEPVPTACPAASEEAG